MVLALILVWLISPLFGVWIGSLPYRFFLKEDNKK